MGPSNESIRLFVISSVTFFHVSVVSKIWEKYNISGMSQTFLEKIFKNTLILWINAAWLNMIALKMYFQASITNNEKWAIPKLFIA